LTWDHVNVKCVLSYTEQYRVFGKTGQCVFTLLPGLSLNLILFFEINCAPFQVFNIIVTTIVCAVCECVCYMWVCVCVYQWCWILENCNASTCQRDFDTACSSLHIQVLYL